MMAMRPCARFDRPDRPGAARLALAALCLVVLSPGLAGAGTSARSTLENFFQQAIAIQTGATSATQARDDVRGLARALFDGREASRRALGPDWARRTRAERDDFARTFTGVLERAYLAIVQARLPRDRPPTIRVIGEHRTGERVAVVHTTVRTRDGSDAQLDYQMARPGEAWLVRDVVIDGVSLVDNYRAQFARTRRRSSYAALVERLRTITRTGPPALIGASAGSRPDVIVASSHATGPAITSQTP